MKVKELISLLAKEDPETEVCVDNATITSLDSNPAYYDGRLHKLNFDENGKVVSAVLTSNGNKIRLRIQTIDEAIFANPDLSVTSDRPRKEDQAMFDRWKQEAINTRKEVNGFLEIYKTEKQNDIKTK